MKVGDKVVLVKDTPFASEGYIDYVKSIDSSKYLREAEVELEGFPGLFAYESELQVLKECSQQKAEQGFEVGDVCLLHGEGDNREVCILEVGERRLRVTNWPLTNFYTSYKICVDDVAMVLWNRFAEKESEETRFETTILYDGYEKKCEEFVHSPKHYSVFDGIEAIEIIAKSMTKEMFRGYCFGNMLKYRLRCGKKDNVQQELDKADKYQELFDKYKHLCKD